MRLIDADELMKDRVNNDPVRIAAKCEPTAYDIDEKVSKLEELIEENVGYLRATPEASDYIKAIRDAIEIVKGGAE